MYALAFEKNNLNSNILTIVIGKAKNTEEDFISNRLTDARSCLRRNVVDDFNAYANLFKDEDDETLRQLHVMCVNEVRKINGVIDCEDAVRYQKE